jgi:hypothetical protein
MLQRLNNLTNNSIQSTSTRLSHSHPKHFQILKAQLYVILKATYNRNLKTVHLGPYLFYQIKSGTSYIKILSSVVIELSEAAPVVDGIQS